MDEPTSPESALDLGEFCRRVEEHLARVNRGNLVRVFGPAFELVRRWYLAGVPLSIVLRGIQDKAERHQAGRSKRPLRLEFCESDVEALFADWRRAVGVAAATTVDSSSAEAARPTAPERNKTSLTRQIDRAIDKLSRAAGRLDAREEVRADLAVLIDGLVVLRDSGRRARGDGKKLVRERAASLDHDVAMLARRWAGPSIAETTAEAERDLAVYRARMPPEAWARSVEVSVDRMLRDRLGLPTLELDLPE